MPATIVALMLFVSTIGISAIFVSISMKHSSYRNKKLLKRLGKAGTKHELSFSKGNIQEQNNWSYANQVNRNRYHKKKFKQMKNPDEDKEAYRGILLISIFEVLAL